MSKSEVKRKAVQNPKAVFEELVDELIAVTKDFQFSKDDELGEYQGAGQKDLDEARAKLVKWFELQTRK